MSGAGVGTAMAASPGAGDVEGGGGAGLNPAPFRTINVDSRVLSA